MVGTPQMTVDHNMMCGDEYVSSVQYSPDGARLAAGSWDQNAYLFDATNAYKLLYILKGNSSSIEHVNFSADSQILITNSKDAQRHMPTLNPNPKSQP